MRTWELGKAISMLRKERGLTREEVAVAFGCSAATVGRWEREETIPLPVYARQWKEVKEALEQ